MAAHPEPAQSGMARRMVANERRICLWAWLALVTTTVGLLVAAIPSRYNELLVILQTLAPAAELAAGDQGSLSALYATAFLTFELTVAAVFIGTALLIAWRRPDDRAAMLVSGMMVAYIAWISPALDTLATTASLWWSPAVVIQALGMTGAATFFLIFPDGRFVPAWTRLWALGLAGWGLVWVLVPTSPLYLADPFHLSVSSFALLMGCWAVGLGAQLYRFTRQSNPVRQQTKSILFGVAIGVLGYLAFGIDRILLPALYAEHQSDAIRDLIAVSLFLALILVIPASFTLAILRYHLWDIDIIIRGTLVYGLSTAVLAGIYVAAITLSQRLFVAVTGEKSDAAIVLTTLVVASSLTPVKTRLETLADTYLKDRSAAGRPTFLWWDWYGGTATCRVRGMGWTSPNEQSSANQTAGSLE